MTNRQNKWLKKKLTELREEFNWCCAWCGSADDLEFAHLKHTGVKGAGRGLWKRYYDIKNHKDSFMLMCKECHRDFDMLMVVDFDENNN